MYWQIKYDFQWLQAPIQLMKFAKTDKTMKFQPLAAMNVSLLKSFYSRSHSFKALILSKNYVLK